MGFNSGVLFDSVAVFLGIQRGLHLGKGLGAHGFGGFPGCKCLGGGKINSLCVLFGQCRNTHSVRNISTETPQSLDALVQDQCVFLYALPMAESKNKMLTRSWSLGLVW